MQNHTTRKKAEEYDGLSHPFFQLVKELKVLGLKKPTDTLSESKVKFINRILTDVKELIDGEPEARYLDFLDDDTLPEYGDAILILSQYEGALAAFRERYYGHKSGHGYTWFIAD
ncbi:hypothetical protein QBK99_13305 [Corticibacterium sp. UT-5YL-CI-8]|nr:hypothetical protein [Tianweitania sp. UT-5YL-CI-8]